MRFSTVPRSRDWGKLFEEDNIKETIRTLEDIDLFCICRTVKNRAAFQLKSKLFRVLKMRLFPKGFLIKIYLHLK